MTKRGLLGRMINCKALITVLYLQLSLLNIHVTEQLSHGAAGTPLQL